MKQIDWIKEEEKKLKVIEDLAAWLDSIKDEPMPKWIERGFLKPKPMSTDEVRVYRRNIRRRR